MTDLLNPGKFFILGFDGIQPDKSFLSLIESYPPAGIIFLGSNYRSPEQLKSLITRFRRIIGKDIILSVDQEPGRVQRLKDGFPESLSPREYVTAGRVDDYANWCEQTAATLSNIGINLNLAPVVDMTPFGRSSPVLSHRSFGDDVNKVIEYSEILIEAHRKYNILTCAKHFPGLGSASGDPHERLSVSDESEEKFIDYHWKPFIAAATQGVDLLMTTHLLAKALDDENPATYSSKLISMIRERIGFNGPVISDDLLMTGAGDCDNIGTGAVKALEAGHNMVIISKDVTVQRRALERVVAKYKSDENFREKIDRSEYAIKKIKEKISTR
ncbi:MAG: glycoside hydrolase family 3 N-terminal domain-containing protein [candidate division Zixibacteria bacterium]